MAVQAPEESVTILENSTQTKGSAHRLPTFAASQALQSLQNGANATVSSGSDVLDRVILQDNPTTPGGFERGKVAEIWGPSGAGKTALALSTAVQAVKNGESVVWIDGKTPLSAARRSLLSSCTPSTARKVNADQFEATKHGSSIVISMPTLSHLLALILHAPQDFPPSNTALIVIDDLNALIDLDYPRSTFAARDKNEQQKWQAGRRYAVLGSLVSSLNKLAVLHNMVIIVTTGNSSRMRFDNGLRAALGPGIGGSEWEAGIWTRLVVFRDFGGRFVGVQKCRGRNLMPLDPTADIRNLVSFEIITDCATVAARSVQSSQDELNPQDGPVKTATSHEQRGSKRPYEEIADSDEESLDAYGWTDGDADLILEDTTIEKPAAAKA